MVRAGCLLSSIEGEMMGFMYSQMGVDGGSTAIELHGSFAKADMAVGLGVGVGVIELHGSSAMDDTATGHTR